MPIALISTAETDESSVPEESETISRLFHDYQAALLLLLKHGLAQGATQEAVHLFGKMSLRYHWNKV